MEYEGLDRRQRTLLRDVIRVNTWHYAMLNDGILSTSIATTTTTPTTTTASAAAATTTTTTTTTATTAVEP